MFETILDILRSKSAMRAPYLEEQFIVTTDASDFAIKKQEIRFNRLKAELTGYDLGLKYVQGK